jgi:uroporphyrinogen decarboxylase
LRGASAISDIEAPRVRESEGLTKALDAIRGMKDATNGDTPILGVVMSPFSLPVMQLGFEAYLELLYGDPALVDRLMSVNEEFCVEWANAQIDAGANAICYFDPVSSPTIVPTEIYLRHGNPVSKRAISRFTGPTAVHFASGRCLPIIDQVAMTGALAIGVSAMEDLRELKTAAKGKLALVGNLNSVEMWEWAPDRAEAEAKRAIAAAGPGGGFILSDNHGEIPWQVPDETLLAISDAVRRWGRYPLEWIGGSDGG